MTDHTLLGTDDAQVWAQEFCERFEGDVVRSVDLANDEARTRSGGIVDVGLMISWFASAIETGKGFEREKLKAEVERLALAYIEATNPGIDMDEVRRSRDQPQGD